MSKNNKSWREYGQGETLLRYWQECKLVQPQWKRVLRFLKKLKIEYYYYNIVILLLYYIIQYYYIILVYIIQYNIIGEGNGNPLQYSCLENPMDGGAWQASVHGVAKSWTQLSNFTFTFHFNALEKEMATHSSVLAWRIPGTGEPAGLQSMGLHRVGHD